VNFWEALYRRPIAQIFLVSSYVEEGTYLLSCRSAQNNKGRHPMTRRAQEYRHLAERVRDYATQTDTEFAAEWEQVARCYLLLAEQAEQNKQADIFDDPILPKPD